MKKGKKEDIENGEYDVNATQEYEMRCECDMKRGVKKVYI